ncbi:ribosomal protein S18-alanine N-acetyltransferase [Nocardioides sp.]|uniref:ribosomal protein S18-alanine N-acetyltransferase n=1 Tax=Nocardioides sp. TaxID=35761 RepID=UPI003562A636
MIRSAVAADAAAIAEIEQQALGIDAWAPGLVEQGVCGELPTVHYLVAEVEGRVAGYAAASIVAEIAELQRIAVDRDHRRAGLAAGLLSEVVRRAADEGADRLLLEVREDNVGALAFYAAAGFTEIARRRHYYRDGATAAVLLLPVGKGSTPAAQVEEAG